MKKKILLFLFLSTLFISCGSEKNNSKPELINNRCKTEAMQQSVNTKSVYEAYNDIAEYYLDKYGHEISVGLISINDDDIEELIIIPERDVENEGAYIFTIIDNEAVPVIAPNEQSFGGNGGFTYYDKKNCFMHSFEIMGDEDVTSTEYYYSINNKTGEAIMLDEFTTTCEFETERYSYYHNGKIVTEDDYTGIYQHYISLNGEQTITYDDLTIIKDINEFNISNMREIKGDDSKTVEDNHNQITQDNLESTLTAIEGTYIFKESDGTEGYLMINKNEDGSYDLNDSVAADGTGIYANSSNIERADDNRLFIKYPKTVYDDGDAVFEFYIWQIQDNEIQVYYSPNSFDDTNYLYTARMEELSKIKASFQGKYILDKNDLASIYDTRTAVDNAANFEGDWKSTEVEGTHSGDITISNQTNKGFHFDGVFFYHHGGIEKDDAPNVGDASGEAYFVNEHLAICSTLTDTEYGGIDNSEGYAVFYLSDGHLYITTEGTVGCMGGMITMNGEYSLE